MKILNVILLSFIVSTVSMLAQNNEAGVNNRDNNKPVITGEVKKSKMPAPNFERIGPPKEQMMNRFNNDRLGGPGFRGGDFRGNGPRGPMFNRNGNQKGPGPRGPMFRGNCVQNGPRFGDNNFCSKCGKELTKKNMRSVK